MDDLQTYRKEYWDDVRSIASDIKNEVRLGDLPPDEAYERIDDACDNQWTIYTYRAKLVVAFLSDNPDALADELGSDELVHDGNLNWSGMAYFAMRADIAAQLGDLEAIAQEGADERDSSKSDAE